MLFGFYFDKETVMELIFIGMAFFGTHLIEKGLGEGKKIFYFPINRDVRRLENNDDKKS